MNFQTFKEFLTWADKGLTKGPFCFVFAEDDVEVVSTVDHHRSMGFAKIVVVGEDVEHLIDRDDDTTITVNHALPPSGDVNGLMNQIIPLVAGEWVYYGYNAEYLHYPFCESRSIGELATFSTEERRATVLTYVIDLYAPNLDETPSGVHRQDACLDRSGYYALSRKDKWNNDLERQMDFFGGLRWRFEEHVPAKKRRIDRVAIFKAKQDLVMNADHTFNDPEYNTYSCPWHNNITATVCSFRTAKALKRNPGSTFDIKTFYWHNSTTFRWSSQQLMDLGLMEPGQWF